MENKKEAQIIVRADMARALLKAGCTLIDIKPERSNKYTGKDKSVFVFKNDEKFQAEFKRITSEFAAAKNEVAAE